MNEATKQEQEQAASQARAQVGAIVDMMKALATARESGAVTFEGDEYDEDSMREHIDGNALSVEVRSDWHAPGEESEVGEFTVLLCTGGPAVRIIGELDSFCEPSSVRVQYQDWFAPWTEWLGISSEQREAVLLYCQLHYFGQ